MELDNTQWFRHAIFPSVTLVSFPFCEKSNVPLRSAFSSVQTVIYSSRQIVRFLFPLRAFCRKDEYIKCYIEQ